MIRDRPLIDQVRLFVLRPDVGRFVTDTSLLNGPDTLAAGPESTRSDILATAVEQLTIYRGVDVDSRGATPGTLTVRLKAALTDLPYLRVGAQIQATDIPTLKPFFTGKIRGITQETIGKPTQTTYVTVTATDVVADLANTPRNGAASGFGEWEIAKKRADRYAVAALTAGVTLAHTIAYENGFDTITNLFNGPTATEAAAGAELSNNWVYVAGAPPYIADLPGGGYGPRFPGGSRMSRKLTGLTPGQNYLLVFTPHSLSLNLNASRIWVDNNPITIDSSMYGNPLAFIAHSDTVTLTWEIPETTTVQTLSLWTASPLYRPCPQADTIFDSNLAAHLDRLVASLYADTYWLIDNEGKARIMRAPALSSATLTLSDDADPSYIELVETSNTSDTISSVQMTIARRTMSDAGWIEETQADTLTDVTIAATYGGRALAVETSSASLPILQNVAAELLTTPSPTPRQITLNNTQAATLDTRLDLLTPIKIRRNGLTTAARIIGISHVISPTRWMIHLDLTGK